jgi:iron complex transport system permease protein
VIESRLTTRPTVGKPPDDRRRALAAPAAIRRPRPALVIGALAGALGVALVLGATFGSVAIEPASLGAMALNRTGLVHVVPTWQPQDEVIVFDVRLPRVVAAALIGIALGTAGVIFQGLLRNPLADPFLLGTSGGASLGAIVGILIATPLDLLGFGVVPLASFVGALLSTGLVYRLARVGGRTPVVPLLLAGFAVSTVLNYFVSLLLILNDRLQLDAARIYAWLLGGVAVSEWSQLAVAAPVVIVAVAAATALAPSLNALALGDETAERLGVAVERQKAAAMVVGSLLTGLAVTLGGLIGFVGLVVPHVVRLATGPDHRLLVPASALAGGSFVVVADLLARSLLAPTELPVGILTAFLGGPYFLFLLRRSRREFRA